MDDISTLNYNALTNYFNYLEKVGYMKDYDVNLLLLLDYILDFIEEFNEDLLEEDYTMLTRIVNCIYSNSCLIGWNNCTFKLKPDTI